MKPKAKNIIVPDGSEQIVYQGKNFEIVESTVKIGERTRVFENARRTPGVRLIVLSDDKQKILLSREHRHQLGEWDFRLPGGKVFDSLEQFNQALTSGKNIGPIIEQAAITEAREEVGIDVQILSLYVSTKCGGMIEWDLHYFVVEKFGLLESAELGEGENIEPIWVSLKQAKELALSGEMKEDRSVAVLLRYIHSINQ